MGEVYLHKSAAADNLLGRVEDSGRLYRSFVGPDDIVGRLYLDTGKVYSQRLGPDECIGRVELHGGRVYRDVPAGPDEYLGRVNENGCMDYHLAGQTDEHIGRIGGNASLAQAGAAFLLLVWPAFAESQ